jgi:DNA-binding MarR family transcriptional regulator
MDTDDPFDLEELRYTEEVLVPARRAVTPRKIQKRRKHFVQVPWTWIERLEGATGQTYRLALVLLYLHWKGKSAPTKLPNGMLKIDGVSRQSKWRALADLEQRGLINVERRPKRSPIIRLLV